MCKGFPGYVDARKYDSGVPRTKTLVLTIRLYRGPGFWWERRTETRELRLSSLEPRIWAKRITLVTRKTGAYLLKPLILEHKTEFL